MASIKRSASFLLMFIARLLSLVVLYIAVVSSIYEFHHHRIVLLLWVFFVIPGFVIPLLTAARWLYIAVFLLMTLLSATSYLLAKRGPKKFRSSKVHKIANAQKIHSSDKCPDCGDGLIKFEQSAWSSPSCEYLAACWPNKPVVIGFESTNPVVVGVAEVDDATLFVDGSILRWATVRSDGSGPLTVHLASN